MFEKFSEKVAKVAGGSGGFAMGLMLVVVWLCTGPIFQFSDTWQLLINTPTTVITFLMLFLIQNTQLKTSLAQKVQINELALAISNARNFVVSVDKKSLSELTEIEKQQIIRAAHMLQGESE